MVELFSNIYVITRLREMEDINGRFSGYKIITCIILVQALLFAWIYYKGANNYFKAYILGPIIVISMVDATYEYIYDIDIWFLLIIQAIVVGIHLISYILQSGVGYISNYKMTYTTFIFDYCFSNFLWSFMSSIILFALTLILSRVKGGMGDADPYLYFAISMGFGSYKTIILFFLSYILAGLYIIAKYLLINEIEDRIALGPFICMAFLLI